MFCPQLAIFDLDGTLIEAPNEFLFEQAEAIFPKLGYGGISRVELEDSFSDFDFFRFVLEDEREKVTEEFWQVFCWKEFPKPVPICGALDVLEGLRQGGVSVAVATARMMEIERLKEDLAPTGLLDYIHLISTRPGLHVHWTDKRESIRMVCESLGVLPENAMMVGDIPTDLTSARDVGVGFTVAVQTGGLKDHILLQAEPDVLLPSVGELLKVIRFE